MAVYVMYKNVATSEATWQLTDKQQKELVKKAYEVVESAGGKIVAVYRTYGRGKNIYIHSYPSLEAAEKARMAMQSREGLGLNRYWTWETEIMYELPLGS